MNFLQIYITGFSSEAQTDEARTRDGSSPNGCGDINDLISCTAINMQALRPILAGIMAWPTLFAVATFSQVPGNSKNAKESEETCRVSGSVVRAADGSPLKGATVRLENGEDHEHTIAAKTASDGRYELRNLPAGRYKLIVNRNGYVRQEFGQRKASNPGAAFTLLPGQTKTDVCSS